MAESTGLSDAEVAELCKPVDPSTKVANLKNFQINKCRTYGIIT